MDARRLARASTIPRRPVRSSLSIYLSIYLCIYLSIYPVRSSRIDAVRSFPPVSAAWRLSHDACRNRWESYAIAACSTCCCSYAPAMGERKATNMGERKTTNMGKRKAANNDGGYRARAKAPVASTRGVLASIPTLRLPLRLLLRPRHPCRPRSRQCRGCSSSSASKLPTARFGLFRSPSERPWTIHVSRNGSNACSIARWFCLEHPSGAPARARSVWRAPEDARRICGGYIASTSRERKTGSVCDNWAQPNRSGQAETHERTGISFLSSVVSRSEGRKTRHAC